MNEGSSGARSTKEETRSRVSAMAERARDRAGDAADSAKGKAESTISRQKDMAAGQLDSISSALRQTSGSLRGNDQDAIAGFVEDAASQVDRLSGYLQNRSVGDLLSEVQRFARREPALFLGGAFLIGIAGSRFMKASERHSHDRSFDMNDSSWDADREFREPAPALDTPYWE